MIAHLDAMEARVVALLLDIRMDIRQLREDVAGIKLDVATHGHEGEQ